MTPGGPIPTHELGRTGLRVTSLGLGLAAIGRPAYITTARDHDLGPRRDVDDLERRCHHLLDVAAAAGIGYIDVARSYGRAEEYLASWLRGRPANAPPMTVGSKWGYRYTGAWQLDAPVHEVKDHSLPAFQRQHAESAAILGPALGLYQIHSATPESGVLEDRAVLEALLDLAGTGLAVGLTVSGVDQGQTIRRALEIDVGGQNPFTVVQATWNVLETSAGPALAEAHEAGWGVLIKEALANGDLSPAGPVATRLERVAGEHGVTTDQIALAVTLAQPWVDVVLSGAVTDGQLRSNVGALTVHLRPEDHQRIAELAVDPARYWQRRSARPWR